jgi:hypothetical protein
MSRFLIAMLLGRQYPQRFRRQRRHIIAWLAAQMARRVPLSASYSKGRSQFHCVGAYIAAMEPAAQSYGAGPIRTCSP